MGRNKLSVIVVDEEDIVRASWASRESIFRTVRFCYLLLSAGPRLEPAGLPISFKSRGSSYMRPRGPQNVYASHCHPSASSARHVAGTCIAPPRRASKTAYVDNPACSIHPISSPAPSLPRSLKALAHAQAIHLAPGRGPPYLLLVPGLHVPPPPHTQHVARFHDPPRPSACSTQSTILMRCASRRAFPPPSQFAFLAPSASPHALSLHSSAYIIARTTRIHDPAYPRRSVATPPDFLLHS